MKRELSATLPTGRQPILLTLPGLNNSGPSHWQSLWEEKRDDCFRVDFGMWERPHRNVWLNKLDAAIGSAPIPVILVAHSLACHAVAWWNRFAEPRKRAKVTGALLVAPPSVENLAPGSRLAPFSPLVRERLAFPSILAASRNDEYSSFGHSRTMARLWGSRLVDAGWIGHINAESGLGCWPYGEFLVDRLIRSLSAPPERQALHGPGAARIDSAEISLNL
ncbi:MAG: alpha/beta hydrolase [Erythrobacter sp.]|jgi:hypothetical protein